MDDDVEALRDRCPLRRSSRTTPRWDLVDKEICSGGIRVLALYLVVWGYVGIYRRKEYVGGATRGPRGWRARPLPRGLLDCFLTSTPSPLDHVCSKKTLPKVPFRLDSV